MQWWWLGDGNTGRFKTKQSKTKSNKNISQFCFTELSVTTIRKVTLLHAFKVSLFIAFIQFNCCRLQCILQTFPNYLEYTGIFNNKRAKNHQGVPPVIISIKYLGLVSGKAVNITPGTSFWAWLKFQLLHSWAIILTIRVEQLILPSP